MTVKKEFGMFDARISIKSLDVKTTTMNIKGSTKYFFPNNPIDLKKIF